MIILSNNLRYKKERIDGALLRLNFFGDRKRYHIDFWKPTLRRLGTIFRSWSPPTETPGKFCSFAILPRPSHPKALPNTDQLSSNCVSRLARSLDPSATVIPLQALGPEPFVYTRARARVHTYVHVRDVARNPGIPCRGDVATGSARSDASNTPLRWKQWSATGFSLGGNSRIRIANEEREKEREEGGWEGG